MPALSPAPTHYTINIIDFWGVTNDEESCASHDDNGGVFERQRPGGSDPDTESQWWSNLGNTRILHRMGVQHHQHDGLPFGNELKLHTFDSRRDLQRYHRQLQLPFRQPARRRAGP